MSLTLGRYDVPAMSESAQVIGGNGATKRMRPTFGRPIGRAFTNVFAWMGFSTMSLTWLAAGSSSALAQRRLSMPSLVVGT